MALIKCPECGKEVSDKADVCPSCGYPIKKVEEKKQKESVTSILSLVFLILGSMFDLVYMSTEENGGLAVVCLITSIAFMIIAHLKKDKKCVCATIAFWLISIGIAVFLIGLIFFVVKEAI